MFDKKAKEIEKRYKSEIRENNRQIHSVLRSMDEFNAAYNKLKKMTREAFWMCDGLDYDPDGRPFDEPIEVDFNDLYKLVAGFDDRNSFVYWFEVEEENEFEQTV